MAKRKHVIPALKQRAGLRDEDSLLLRSAESLGRVIGALQRQLDGATKRLYPTQAPSRKRATSQTTKKTKATKKTKTKKTRR